MPDLRPQDGVVQRIVSTERECLAVTEMAPGTLVESHKHEVDKVGTVVRGQIVMAVAGEQRVLTTGDCYRIPAGTAHGARVLQDPVTVVDCFAPPTAELRKVFERQNAAKPVRLP
jgi:mannose-6-phosphate isomerase-like protein (cupin superfamily)